MTTLINKSYIISENVKFLEANTKSNAIAELLHCLFDNNNAQLSQDLFRKILEREEICSTGIGMAVALPHAKSIELDDFHIAIGIHKEGLEWQSIDSIRVHYIFLIVGPEEKKEEYLELLSNLSQKLHDSQTLEKLFLANSKQDVVKYLQT